MLDTKHDPNMSKPSSDTGKRKMAEAFAASVELIQDLPAQSKSQSLTLISIFILAFGAYNWLYERFDNIEQKISQRVEATNQRVVSLEETTVKHAIILSNHELLFRIYHPEGVDRIRSLTSEKGSD